MQMQQLPPPLPGGGAHGSAHVKLHLVTGALPRRKHLHTPVGGSRHENAVQTARELISHALDGPPCAGIGAGALPLSNREGARPLLGKLGGQPPSGRMGSRGATRVELSRGASRGAPRQLGSADGSGVSIVSPRLHQHLDFPQANGWRTPSYGKKAVPIRQPVPPSTTRTTAPAPNPRRGVVTGRMMKRGAKKMTPIAVTPIFHGMHVGPPSANSQTAQEPQKLEQATPSLMATLEARFDMVTTPMSPSGSNSALPMTPIEQLLQRELETSVDDAQTPTRQPITEPISSRELEPEPEPELEPEFQRVPEPAESKLDGGQQEQEGESILSCSHEQNVRPGQICMPVQLQAKQTGSSQRPWLLKLAGEGLCDGLLDSFVKFVHFSVMVEVGSCNAIDDAESDKHDKSPNSADDLMNTSGSFFGTIKLPTDLAAEMSRMETEEVELMPGLSDTPKRVQANRQLERVLGAPRVAKRLTISGISPSPVETVRRTTPEESHPGRGGDSAEQLEQQYLPLMEATVNCAPFETFVNGTATPSANALADQGGRLVAKAILHCRDECQLQPLVIKVDLPWEVSGMIITDSTVSFEQWDGWEDVHLEAVKRKQARCGRKSSIDEGRQKWQAQERERRQSELVEESGSSDSGNDSDDTAFSDEIEDMPESGQDTVDEEIMRLSTVAERKTMELTTGHSSGMSTMHDTAGSGGSTSTIHGLALTKEMRSGPLTRELIRANSAALSSGGFSLTSRSSDSDVGGIGAGGAVAGPPNSRTAMPTGTVTSPLAFTQENVGAPGSSLSSTNRSTARSTSGASRGSQNSTGSSGSLEVWMGLPKSPRPGPSGSTAGGGLGAAKSTETGLLSPAHESEEVDSIAHDLAAGTMGEDDNGENDAANESDDWSDLEEDEFVGCGGGIDSQSIQSTMNKFDQLEASWRRQLRSSGFHD